MMTEVSPITQENLHHRRNILFLRLKYFLILFVLSLFVIVLSMLLRFTSVDYHLDIFKHLSNVCFLTEPDLSTYLGVDGFNKRLILS